MGHPKQAMNFIASNYLQQAEKIKKICVLNQTMDFKHLLIT